jgi:tRNA pseudouridine65 synthase
MDAPFDTSLYEQKIPLIYQDEHLVAVHKPPGLLVHRTPISQDKVFLLQWIRRQLDQLVYPAHRLDRATSGIIIFGKTPEAGGRLGYAFGTYAMEKTYLAIVRGWIPQADTIDYPLMDAESGQQEALPAMTKYTCLQHSEMDEEIGLRYKTARFSLAEISPLTGRRHQIRKHFSHIRHPIIGDKRHGDVKHNTFFRENYQMSRMLLHAHSIRFEHPVTKEWLTLCAPPDASFRDAGLICGLDLSTHGL